MAYFLLSGAAVVVGVLAYLQQVPWYVLALSVLGAIAIAFLVLNQSRIWWEGRRVKSDKWLKDNVPRWLSEGGDWLAPEQKPEQGEILRVMAEDRRVDIHGGTIRVLVSVTEERPELVFFETTLMFERTELAKWPDEALGRWRREVDIELARFGVGFGDYVTPNKDWQITIRNPLPREAFTKLAMLEQVWLIKRAAILVRELLRKLADATPPQQSTPDTESESPQQAPVERP